MQEDPNNPEDKGDKPSFSKPNGKHNSKEKKKRRPHKSNKNKNNNHFSDKKGKNRRKRNNINYLGQFMSNIDAIQQKNVNDIFSLTGSFDSDKNINNRPGGNVSSFDNYRYDNNYNRRVSYFDYGQSDNGFDNNYVRGNNSNFNNYLFDDFQQQNRINSRYNNNQFPFQMNVNYSSNERISQNPFKNLWNSSPLYEQKLEKISEENNDLKRQIEMLKKKNDELFQSNLSLINNQKISQNNNNNELGQIIPINISRTRLMNQSHGYFKSTAFKLVFNDNDDLELYNSYKNKLYTEQDQDTDVPGFISFEKDVFIDNNPPRKCKEVCILVQYSNPFSLYQKDFPRSYIILQNTSIFNKINDLANESRVIEKFNEFYGRGRDLTNKLKVIESPIITKEILSENWDTVKKVYSYNIYGRKSFDILFRIENFFKINDLKICYLRYDNVHTQFYGFVKGARVAICQLTDISSIDYSSLTDIIYPSFRPVYGIDLRYESIITNYVVYFFFITKARLSNLIVPGDRAAIVSSRIKEIEVYNLEDYPYPPKFIDELYYLNIQGEDN